MIELVFGESAAGTLKLAKSMKHGESLSGASSVIVIDGINKEQREIMREARKPRNWSGVSMEGSANDVAALTLALDIGDISDMDSDMNARKKLFDDMFAYGPGASDKLWETNQHTLTRLQAAKATLEPVRMWIYTGDPAEMCALYFVCYLMVDTRTPLSSVCIPTEIEKDDHLVSYRNTGEIIPEELGKYTKYEAPISELRRKVYANIWSGLARENAPLRVIINGRIIGVPKDFYDFMLRANMPEGEFKVAGLIGKTLGQISGLCDSWLFLRIQTMLQAGELIEVSAATADHPYSGVVKRNKMFTTL